MERIVSEKITKHFTKNGLVTKEQHGFIKGKNCTTNLLETLDEITFELYLRETLLTYSIQIWLKLSILYHMQSYWLKFKRMALVI